MFRASIKAGESQNKSDLFDGAILEKKVSAIRDRYPTTPIITLSARTGAGLSDWLDTC